MQVFHLYVLQQLVRQQPKQKLEEERHLQYHRDLIYHHGEDIVADEDIRFLEKAFDCP